jgi:hypothetical protein
VADATSASFAVVTEGRELSIFVSAGTLTTRRRRSLNGFETRAAQLMN